MSHQLQSSHLSVIQELKICSVHDGGTFIHVPLWLRPWLLYIVIVMQFYTFFNTTDKTVKLWKVSERRKRTDGFNLRDEMGSPVDPSSITSLRVPVFKPMELMVEASPRRVFANAHTYHINSISVNSDGATYLSADDLRINLWHMENNDQSFSIFSVSELHVFTVAIGLVVNDVRCD